MAGISAAVLTVTTAAAQAPERTVTGTTLRSERDPAVTLDVPKTAQYVGADRWVLYGVADCEVHVFVEADANKRVTRLYWIQFEGYIPGVNGAYTGYTSPTKIMLGSKEFIADGGIYGSDSPTRAGSDREHVQKLIASKGYTLPSALMTRRLVHLFTPDKRKELMIIYAEDLATTGYTLADFSPGGKAVAERTRLESELLQRAAARISAK